MEKDYPAKLRPGEPWLKQGFILQPAERACLPVRAVTMSAVATAVGIEIKSGTIRAEGDLDFRGTLGVSKDVAVGFKNIRLYFHFDSNATAEQIDSLAKLTERYCVVYQTLTKGVPIATAYNKK